MKCWLLIIFLTASVVPYGFAGLGVVASQSDDARAIESFIARQARRERGEEYQEARKILEGDLEHDGAPETVVLYTIESQGGSNNYVQYIAVFVRRNGTLKPLTHAEVGGKSKRSVELASVAGQVINLDCKEPARRLPKVILLSHKLTRSGLSGRGLWRKTLC
jgi:hypothetical protein